MEGRHPPSGNREFDAVLWVLWSKTFVMSSAAATATGQETTYGKRTPSPSKREEPEEEVDPPARKG